MKLKQQRPVHAILMEITGLIIDTLNVTSAQ
ncbi:hypothetical protein MTBPR1_10606 [Candidatus Terasakiella magnetica]|uniref:Uncharacterized protein n=1 Tax=Candidatus Terasakiella magnetica TaxID=1867952 RepID=A0A1C3RDL7_9PROT|nr:hypothetical protein MTBPR1_10606 [Candidatus Terasakiella magnetica]